MMSVSAIFRISTDVFEKPMDPKVTALVYVAARALDADENYPALAAKFPASPANKEIANLILRAAGYTPTNWAFAVIGPDFQRICRPRPIAIP
jgi:hypothetical protein